MWGFSFHRAETRWNDPPEPADLRRPCAAKRPRASDYGREYATTLLAFDPTNTIPPTTAGDD
jgi:hypothetical protein